MPMVSGTANLSLTKYACLFHFCDKKLTDKNNANEYMVWAFNIALVQTKDLTHNIIIAEAEQQNLIYGTYCGMIIRRLFQVQAI